jgi:hypothetical protein
MTLISTRAAVAVFALALAALVFGVAASAHGTPAKPRNTERLVVRGDDTVADAPCPTGVCPLEIQDGTFRGTIGSGPYSGHIDLAVKDGFANGEGGVCAPIRGRLVLGEGTPDRLVLALDGDSCQDGKGDVKTASFTGLARFVVAYGTGRYAHATGAGIGTFVEDAADREHMTLIGRIAR